MSRLAQTLHRREVPGDVSLAGVSPLLQRLYAARGIRSSQELDLSLAELLPPSLMLSIDDAARRLHEALDGNERVLVVGDFDADGATSTALAVAVLRHHGAHVDYLVPNRFEFGYGLTPEIVELARERDPDLIVTVDNGISSIEGVAAAIGANIDVLITDHHLPGAELPAASVIVNPNQPDCDFPSKALAGVGVMFYVLMALRARLRWLDWYTQNAVAEPHLASFLDLVALGTVADVVPLDRNNRILVEGGLQRIRRGQARAGVAALLSVAGRDARDVVATDLGFAAGPRLNAAGRLDDMSLGIECLLCDDPARARALALELDAMNRERQRIERTMEEGALQALDRLSLDPYSTPGALIIYDEHWHQGVVGILASRIKDRFHCPVIAFAKVAEGELKGSGRCIPGLHMRDLLDTVAARNPKLISRFGGHAMAAGLSLKAEDLPAFRDAFTDAVVEAGGSELKAVLETDGSLKPESMSLANAEDLRMAGPWGQHFPEPLFDGEFVLLAQRIVGERHLKLRLRHPDTASPIDAIAFSVDTDRWPDPSIQRIRAAYRLDVNVFRGERSLQLRIEQLDVP